MGNHVILGGNGIVGREAAAALLAAGHIVSSLGRRPASAPGVTAIVADVRDPTAVRRAVSGAEVAYLVVGLPYRIRVWRRDWPLIIRNAIDACTSEGTHLVFFDNVYAYGKVDGPMTESTPVHPSSKKGQVRAGLLRTLDAASEAGLTRTIARSADFYGPGASSSVFNILALDAVAAGKTPTWLLDASLPHSMTYTPDVGRALVILGTDERARDRTWHLPTAPALTGAEYLRLATGDGRKHRTMSMATMRLAAVFNPTVRELLELAYQNNAPYRFDSSAFETTFGMSPTPYAEGIARTLEFARSHAR